MIVKDKLRKCLDKIENMTKEEVIKELKEKGLYEELYVEHECDNSGFIIKTKLDE